MRRGRKIAKVAMARKLAIQLFWMMRKEWDYEQVKRFGPHAGQDQMRRDGAFVPVLASASIGPHGILDGADKEVDPKRKQDDYADGRQDGLERRVGQIGKEVMPPEENHRKKDEIAGDGADSRRRGYGANRRSRRGGWPAC
jgi:hypothetical protein